MEHVKTLKAALVAFCGSLTALFGWFGWLVIMFIGCMLIDYITGSVAASKEGEWSSERARDGLWHKCGSLIAVIVAGIADIVIGLIINNMPGIQLPFTYDVLICPVVVVWYILTELGSIAENAGKMGAPVPPFLRKIIKTLKGSADAAGEKILPSGDDEHKDE